MFHSLDQSGECGDLVSCSFQNKNAKRSFLDLHFRDTFARVQKLLAQHFPTSAIEAQSNSVHDTIQTLIMSESDPHDDSRDKADEHCEHLPKPSPWDTSNTTLTPLPSSSAFAQLSQGDVKRPTPSFGFAAPRASFATGTHTTPGTSLSTSGLSSFAGPSFGASSFGALSHGGPSSGAPSFGAPSISASSVESKPSFASSAFGTSPSPFGQRKPPTPSLPQTLTPTHRSSQPPTLPGDDVLSRALLRASQHRPALFGRKEIDADSLIGSYRDSLDQETKIEDLITDLVDAAKSHPMAMDFLRHIFDKASRNDGATPPPLPPSRQRTEQVDAQRALNNAIYTIFCKRGWSEDLCDYILRMIVFGLDPREIRAAVKADLDSTSGHRCVSDKEVETLITWMRGPGSRLVRESKFTGTAMDFFRPAKREKRVFADEVAASAIGWDKCFCAAEDGDRRSPADHNVDASPTLLHANQSKDAQRNEEFRFMDLPAEMRVLVYKSAITPTGFISLRSCAHHMPASVHPPIATSIFQLSKLVSKEAEGLLMDNTIIVNGCLEFGSRPAIHRSQLPEHILPHIQSLVLVVDFTRIVHTMRVADWRAAQGLIGLKKLRICGIAKPDLKQQLSDWVMTHLRMILERVPADCEVTFGEDGGLDVEAHVMDMVAQIGTGGKNNCTNPDPVGGAHAMSGEQLEDAWKEIKNDVVRGCKSGLKEDFRFADRRANGELDQHYRDLRQRQADMEAYKN